MNIFALDDCPIRSAQWQHDRHVVKMILESMQMISTALDAANVYVTQGASHLYGNPKYPDSLRTLAGVVAKWDSGLGPKGWAEFRADEGFPKPTHVNHPCNIWLRDSVDDFAWLAYHAVALCSEYNYRFRKTHKYHNIAFIASRLAKLARADYRNHTPFACAMPDLYRLMCSHKFDTRNEDSIWAYRVYYVNEKLIFGQPGKREFARWTNRTVPTFIQDIAHNHRFPRDTMLAAQNCVSRNSVRVMVPGQPANAFGRYHARLADSSN